MNEAIGLTDHIIHITGFTRLEVHFYGCLLLGLCGYIGKRYHVFPGWNLKAFFKENGYGILRATALAVATGYFLPDLLLAVGDKHEALAMFNEHPNVMRKGLHVLGALLGYTGGSLAFDLIKLLYGLPLVGPLIKKGMETLQERLRTHR